jgi:hypothetical protein
MNSEQLDYASPQTRTPVKRSTGQWLILLGAWAIGLVIWAIYSVIIGLIVVRIA